jgi:chitodextrinase
LATNTPITFDGSGSSDPDNDIDTYEWDFGDGNTDSGETVTHTYAADDIYVVTLTVTDLAGNTNTDGTLAVVGSVSPGTLPPVADSGGPYTGTALVSVTFDGSGSLDQDGDIERYQWDFGDGTTGSGATTKHTYSAAGTYNVTLTVTDENGNEDSDGTEADISAFLGGGGGGSSGCFIATAAYGSYMHDDVKVLRDFRDEYLLTNSVGKKFVELYYEYSPPVANNIAEHGSLRVATRAMLTPVVYGIKYPFAVGFFAVLCGLVVIRRKII